MVEHELEGGIYGILFSKFHEPVSMLIAGVYESKKIISHSSHAAAISSVEKCSYV